MSVPRTSTRPVRAEQGQWALGQTTPLNHAEAVKAEDGALNVRARVEEVFARDGFASIPPDDLRERLKWWGLYTQRRQDQPAEATQTAEPADLIDQHFMLRVRSDGGLLTSEQLRAIAWASQTHGRDFADVTDRQNIQLHWIRIEAMPAIWERLEATGLTTAMACGDVPRGFLGCPVAGLDPDELLDATPVIEAVRTRAVANPEFANLPRKFKTSISGCAQQCAQPDINDVAFVGARSAEGEAGFDVWVGGGLGSNPHFAQPLGAFVPPERVPEVWEAVVSVFRDYGYRKSRKRARLKFLMADWGPERFREVMEREYLDAPLADLAERPRPIAGASDHIGVFAQGDGRRYVGVAPRAGRAAGHQLAAVADLAERYGSGRVRLTTQQKIVVPDIAAEHVEEVVATLATLDLPARPSAFRAGTMSCTGLEFCKLALAETKGTADRLYRELQRRIPDWDTDVRINVNGCPNSCARFQIADIGLMGALLPRPDGTKGEGFLVHLGGTLGEDRAFGAKVRGVRVLTEDVPDYVEGLLRRYRSQRAPGQGFTAFVRALDDDALTRFATPPAREASAA